MGESLRILDKPETFIEKTNRFEHELRIGSGEVEINQNKSENIAPVTAVEALKSVAEASQENDSQNILNKLKPPADERVAQLPNTISSAAKSTAINRSLKNLRQQESLPEKTLSKVIHQPVIRVLSEGAAKSMTRPSGLLGGGLLAFIGSVSYFVLAKYIGFQYNYSISFLFFVGGFLIGLALELLVHVMTASRRQVD